MPQKEEDDPELAALPREALVDRARALQTVFRVAQAVTHTRNVEELAGRFVEAVAAYTRFPALVVVRYVPERDGFEIVSQRGFDESKFPARTLLPAKGSLTGLAAERREVLTTEDIANDERVDPPTRAALTANQYTGGACFPVLHDGELLGSFNLIYPKGTAPNPNERSMLSALAATLSVAMAQRVTAERERELEGQARRAQQLESLGVLAGGIAHDFNNLLTGIVANVDLALALSKDAGHAQLETLLAQTLDATGRTTALVKQLLTFSRGGAPLLKATRDLGNMLRDVATFASRGTSVRCDVQIDEPLGVVELDAGQVSQVVQNLVLNACQASPSGSKVSVRARREARGSEGDWVVIEVEDQGKGIAPEHLPQLFEPFFSARPGGTGLGLAVSHSIVRRHGGRLSVRSAPGEGATFSVELPAGDVVATTDVEKPASVARFSGRALVMDDDDAVRAVTDRLLRRLGFEVETARHGAEALELGRRATQEQRPFKVALLDLTVAGGLGGAEIADDLRRDVPGIKLVLSSGYADHVGGGQWDSRLYKPFRLDELADALTRAL